MENIQRVLATFGFIIACIIIYFLTTALLGTIINLWFDDDTELLAMGGWIAGCLLFVIVACILAYKMWWI